MKSGRMIAAAAIPVVVSAVLAGGWKGGVAVAAPNRTGDVQGASQEARSQSERPAEASCGYVLNIESESGTVVEPGGTLSRHVEVLVRSAHPKAGESPAPGSGLKVSFGQGRLGTVEPGLAAVGELRRGSGDKDGLWRGGFWISYKANQSVGLDLVPYRVAGIRESPCVDLNPVSALTFLVVGEYELSLRGEHKGTHGTAESTWKGFFSLTPDGDVNGGGAIVHQFEGRCVQFETGETFRLGRDARNIGDPDRLMLTVGDVTTVSDHMEQDMEDLSCMFGSLKEVGEATLLATDTVLKNLAAAGGSGEGFLTFSLPITGVQGREDETGHWAVTVKPVR